jgi:hypothetical protein
VIRFSGGQCDRLDAPAATRRHIDRTIEAITGGISWVDQHQALPTHEVGVHRLPGHAATSRHLDPHDLLRD